MRHTKKNYEASLPKNLEAVPTRSGWVVYYTPHGEDPSGAKKIGRIVMLQERKFHALAKGKYVEVQTKRDGIWWVYHQANIIKF